MKLPSTSRARPNQQMHLRLTFVLPAAALLFALAATPLRAQDPNGGPLRRGDRRLPPGLPAMPPTSQPVPQPAPQAAPQPAPIAATPVTAVLNERPAHRARVIFANGLLEVRADNSGLVQVLHDISRATGMTISGGVADQRIFGDYGPAAPSTVLATLIDGTGTNMLLRQDPISGAPIELVLSQRAGGPTPVSPNGPGMDDSPFPAETVTPPPPSQPVPPTSYSAPSPLPAPQPANNPLGNPANQSPTASTLNTTNSVPMDTLPTPTTAAPPPQGIVDAPNPPPPGSTSNANGTTTAATPDSIYQQLLQLQKAKAAAANQPNPPPPAPVPAPPAITPH